MAVPLCLHMLVCGGSLDGVTILALVVVQLVILATHFLGVFCDALQGDLAHCLCLAFSDLREQWCRRVSVPLDAAAQWACDPGCSTQALLTTLFPLLSRTSHLSGRCVNDFCHCGRSSALPCQGLPSILLWVSFPLWSFSEAFVRAFSGSCTEDLM